ncbi:MAG TPA: hypothetical protein VEO74_17300 [Thermoanaerobaculia bacterium]|nr:hypothetical protein [Thermoanaerobaculia bacterium]
MSPNRKADLQRKLVMAPIPKPPAGLAERIKSDIPQHLLLDVRKERERFSRAISFNLRVAASVILLIGSVYLALYVLTRGDIERTGMEKPSNVRARKVPAKQPAAAAPARMAEAAPPVDVPKSLSAPAVEDKKQVVVAEAKTEPLAKREETGEVGAVFGGRANGIAAPSAPMAAPPPASPQTDAAPRAAAKKVTADFVPAAVAESITLAPAMLFDIVVARADAELGGAALIQHFAAPAAPPRALRLDAEAAMLEETPLLRVSVDTPEVERPEGGSRPPVAADAKLDIVFDDDAVASHRALAGTTSSSASALPSGTSVTALFEVELKPDVDRRTTIVTVTLRYRSVTDGQEHAITKKLRRSDMREWDAASRRMKSTSLAAALVESLQPKEKVAEKARAAGLNELADIAEKR